MPVVLEHIRLFTPLGIRFRDAATDLPVGDGLRVTAHALDAGARPVTAYRTVSGVYAFDRLPGGPARSDAAASPPDSPPAQPYVVEVRDRLRRFVPVVFTEVLPVRGLYAGPVSVASPPAGGAPGFYLFSDPARPVLPGLAVVRAQLADAGAGSPPGEAPAAFALLEVEVQGVTWYGLADDRGRVAVPFPYPALTTELTGSPPAGRTPLHDQQWPLTVRARYAPAVQQRLAAFDWPELRSLAAQPPALLYPASPASFPALLPAEQVTATLRYGEACVLRTEGEPTLWIQEPPSSP